MQHSLTNHAQVMVALLLMLPVTMGEAADINIEQIQKDLVGSWIVDVGGETRTRTLNIKGAERRPDGIWILDATYGLTDGGQSAVNAELIVKADGYKLQLTTQANSLISAESSGTALFNGSFTPSSGNVRSVRLERLSGEEMSIRVATQMASRMRATIKPPAADVPASCAGFIGGWTGKWPVYPQTWLWVVEVSASCVAKFSHRSTSAFPERFGTAEIKGGVLAFPDQQGIIDSFELHGDELWARHAEPRRNTTAVFRKFQPSEK